MGFLGRVCTKAARKGRSGNTRGGCGQGVEGPDHGRPPVADQKSALEPVGRGKTVKSRSDPTSPVIPS